MVATEDVEATECGLMAARAKSFKDEGIKAILDGVVAGAGPEALTTGLGAGRDMMSTVGDARRAPEKGIDPFTRYPSTMDRIANLEKMCQHFSTIATHAETHNVNAWRDATW